MDQQSLQGHNDVIQQCQNIINMCIASSLGSRGNLIPFSEL